MDLHPIDVPEAIIDDIETTNITDDVILDQAVYDYVAPSEKSIDGYVTKVDRESGEIKITAESHASQMVERLPHLRSSANSDSASYAVRGRKRWCLSWHGRWKR